MERFQGGLEPTCDSRSNLCRSDEGAASYKKIKRKASEVQEGLATHRGANKDASRTSTPDRKASSVTELAPCRAVQAAAKATHSLTCGVPDRESNEVKYLREATELIEAWQQQLQGGLPMSEPPSEHSEVILVERQR